MIFTFWEGRMPDYIALCLTTWRKEFVILRYDNLRQYTDLPIDKLKRYTLPQIADIVRVHVLRDCGGTWLDADTIQITGTLPNVPFLGNDEDRTHSIAYLKTEPHTDLYEEWAEHQDRIIGSGSSVIWSSFGNSFTDRYLKEHDEIQLGNITPCWPETYMIPGDAPRKTKYGRFYFAKGYSLEDLRPTDLLMLHNSWTPEWYKRMDVKQVLSMDCTLSNILREM